MQVVNLWTEVNKAIERLPRKDAQILLHLETLITAGFLSRRRSIVNISITTWNNTFGKEESLRYPSRLEHALRQMRSTVELSLPSLQLREDDAVSKHAYTVWILLMLIRTTSYHSMILIIALITSKLPSKVLGLRSHPSECQSLSGGLCLDLQQCQHQRAGDCPEDKRLRSACDTITHRFNSSLSSHHHPILSIRNLRS
jgi:hypothetical protein